MGDLQSVAQTLEYRWKNPVVTEHIPDQQARLRPAPRLHVNDEPPFSREHASHSTEAVCWLCMFPIGPKSAHSDLYKSWDHVIPRSRGGNSSSANLRIAHRWCNSNRKSEDVNPAMILGMRQRMRGVFAHWFIWEAGMTGGSLNADPWFCHDGWNHDRAFECKSGAD